jgi:hypothetical protein
MLPHRGNRDHPLMGPPRLDATTITVAQKDEKSATSQMF